MSPKSLLVAAISGLAFAIAGFAQQTNPAAVDISFGQNGFALNTPANYSISSGNVVLEQGDDKILVAGSCSASVSLPYPSYQEEGCIWRFLADGSLDTTFGSAGFALLSAAGGAKGYQVRWIFVGGDGAITVFGNATSTCSADSRCLFVARLRGDGRLDKTFGQTGNVVHEFRNVKFASKSFELLPDGTFLAGGSCIESVIESRACLLSLRSDGSLNATFGAAGIFQIPNEGAGSKPVGILKTSRNRDGSILVVGECVTPTRRVYCTFQLSPAGTLDTNYGDKGWVVTETTPPWTVSFISDRRIYGSAGCGDISRNLGKLCVSRYTNAGEQDESFAQLLRDGIQLGGGNPGIVGVVPQQNGRVVFVTQCARPYEGAKACLVRLDAAGSLDPSFGSGGIQENAGPYPTAASYQRDGKILLAGTCLTTRQEMCVWRHFGDPVIAGAKKQMTEYRYAPLNYYFITSRDSEKLVLDSAPGWQRTGASFNVYANSEAGTSPIIRFYFDKIAKNGARGSHFYTLIESEALTVQGLNRSNRVAPQLPFNEGSDSYASPPDSSGSCDANSTPVYRLFRNNTRFPDDPNHRFTIDRNVYNSFVAQGWDGEGVKFCAPK